MVVIARHAQNHHASHSHSRPSRRGSDASDDASGRPKEFLPGVDKMPEGNWGTSRSFRGKGQSDDDLTIGQRLTQEPNTEKSDDDHFGQHFKAFIACMILVNSLQMGGCAKTSGDAHEIACQLSEHVFTFVFLAEFVFKIYVLHMAYFRDGWNRLDLFLVLISVLDAWILTPLGNSSGLREFSSLRLLRLIRIMRLIKLLRSKRELLVLLEGLTASLRSMVWVTLLLGLLIYAAAIICVTSFGGVETESQLTFHTMPEAMFTLFSLSVLADWTDVVMPIIEFQPISAFFFMGFVVLSTFGVLNLIIGVITERTTMVQQEFLQEEEEVKKGEQMESIQSLADMIFEEAPDGVINSTDLKAAFRSKVHGPEIERLMADIQLPTGFSVANLFTMLDTDSSGAISKQEFVHGMAQLIFSSDFQRSCLSQFQVSELKKMIIEMKRELKNEFITSPSAPSAPFVPFAPFAPPAPLTCEPPLPCGQPAKAEQATPETSSSENVCAIEIGEVLRHQELCWLPAKLRQLQDQAGELACRLESKLSKQIQDYKHAECCSGKLLRNSRNADVSKSATSRSADLLDHLELTFGRLQEELRTGHENGRVDDCGGSYGSFSVPPPVQTEEGQFERQEGGYPAGERLDVCSLPAKAETLDPTADASTATATSTATASKKAGSLEVDDRLASKASSSSTAMASKKAGSLEVDDRPAGLREVGDVAGVQAPTDMSTVTPPTLSSDQAGSLEVERAADVSTVLPNCPDE